MDGGIFQWSVKYERGGVRNREDSRENRESDRASGFLLRDFFFFFCENEGGISGEEGGTACVVMGVTFSIF